MQIHSDLKQLYANLKRLDIGEYFCTKEFHLYLLENDLDEIWKDCKDEVKKKKGYILIGPGNSDEFEEVFMYLSTYWYKNDSEQYFDFLLDVLLKYATWYKFKIDYTSVLKSLKDLISREDIFSFTKNFRKIQESKPIKVDEESTINNLSKAKNHPNKVFVVHGHDDKSRLELCNLLKDEFKLEPIVLQESPNNSIETIIKKFERLASDCSMAIVLFTPDDEAGANKRARQNVIFELGYFLGKFQDEKDRKIIILKKGDLEIPSDISGVLYLEYNKAVKEIYIDLKNQLKHWGYKV